MDVNYLRAREQVSLMRASSASCPEARIAHQGLARGYKSRLAEKGFPVGRETDAVPL